MYTNNKLILLICENVNNDSIGSQCITYKEKLKVKKIIYINKFSLKRGCGNFIM